MPRHSTHHTTQQGWIATLQSAARQARQALGPPRRTGLLAAAGLLLGSGALALQLIGITPQGEVARVRQVVAKFDGPAVDFGNPKAPAPLSVSCSDPDIKGTARWLSERNWVYDFDNDLPPGLRCKVERRSDFKPASGEVLGGLSGAQFNTGGPFVQDMAPGTYQPIEEDQHFVLRLNGAATLASVQAHMSCLIEGVGEQVPVRLLDGAERNALLTARGWQEAAKKEPLRYVTLACNRRLPPAAQVQILFDKGVSTPSGVANSVAKRWAYRVRPPFAVNFSCERENAQADCIPIRDLTLGFNAPVSAKLAAAIRLETAGGKTLQPVLGNEGHAVPDDGVVENLRFPAPLPEATRFKIVLPKGFTDASGRPAANADSYPLKVATGPMSPLVKFSAAPFGIVERYAEPDAKSDTLALLPVTVRNVEARLRVQGVQAGKVSDLRPQSDADIIHWLRRVYRYHETSLHRNEVQRDIKRPGKPLPNTDGLTYESRALSLLDGLGQVKTLKLPEPASKEQRPFEVIGIPLEPGFHVVEIASPALGRALLDDRYGDERPMYVRTAALVTNLGVHFKLGRENALAWVTTLDKGLPVADAQVQVSSCDGKPLAQARTNAQGLAEFSGLPPRPGSCGEGADGYFVSARAQQVPAPDGKRVADMAFTWSGWNRGIESWRFNVPTNMSALPDAVAHTVLDRPLLRAGETVSMKHLLRLQNRLGLATPAQEEAPTTLSITHLGSGQTYEQPLQWRKTGTGGLSAASTWAIPPGAKLGLYQISLLGAPHNRQFSTGEFRVEEFRLPVLEGRIAPSDSQPLINPKSVPTTVQINYVAGGPAANLPVRVSAMLRQRGLEFADYGEFNFSPPNDANRGTSGGGEDDSPQHTESDSRVVADKLPLVLGKNGSGQLTLPDIPAVRQPQDLVLEATYADPNGEIQTLRSTRTVWPAGVIVGLKAENWVTARKQMRFQALALGLDGKPQAGVALQVEAVARITTTSRKRLVGGFYTYDNQTEVKKLGELCSGKSDSHGLLSCETELQDAGDVELIVSAKDSAGRPARAASTLTVTRQGELWFGGQDHDRIDVLAEKKSYQPGETAKFQVRMPFRYATALVAVEREGILHTEVVQLNGRDPTISLKVQDSWGPNVYVSVLALRGRLREVPWYSLFTWGYKAPREWWTAFWYEGREYVAPTALVDLSKPAFRLGLAEIRVGTQAHQLAISVKTDKPSYPIRAQAKVTISAKLPNGQPAAGAEVAVAAVDQALLELLPNTSWNLLEAMLQRRSWGVETSTAQMEIIGRRHYGRKAVPAGGGGGHSSTRELLDTLLLWQPNVVLDANGQATLTVPLNDALTTFRIVAVGDSGAALFGTGEARIATTQDLQLISGLPPLVREGDQFRAQLTLRNTTKAAMKVVVTPRATGLTLAAQTVDVPAGESREAAWDVTVPEALAYTRFEALLWEIEAKDSVSGARDALKASQRVVPALPLTVQQATLVQLDGPFSLAVSPPADGQVRNGVARGGLKLALQPKLAEGLPGVRDWFAHYPFICLEQKTSKSIGLRDAKLWQSVAAQIPSYLDSDGLANYFPPRAGDGNHGSDTLTAYVLAATHEAAQLNPAFALSDEVREPMARGLIAFVEGRIQRDFWSPRKDLDMRKLAAIEALSRYGKAQGRILGSLTIAPNQWPTHAVIDWLNILRRVPDAPQREQRLAEATQILKARLSWQGTKLVFSTERDDYWWWLMSNGDVNTARLILAVLDDPAWRDDMGRLANGFISRMQSGAWHTTTANLWGGLALEKFSAKFEAVPVAGTTRASLGSASGAVDWAKVERVKATDASGAPHQTTWFGAPASPGNLRNNTILLPWASKASEAATLSVAHQGAGKPWLTLQSLAAVELKAPFNAGYQISKTITPVEQAKPGQYTRGDVLRITLKIRASTDMTWVAVTDPIPGGATILGNGLGRDSEIATRSERGSDGWLAFEERSFESWRGYYEYLPKGEATVEYTVRLNNAGDFAQPPTRVEAMYAPEVFGEVPNGRVKVVK